MFDKILRFLKLRKDKRYYFVYEFLSAGDFGKSRYLRYGTCKFTEHFDHGLLIEDLTKSAKEACPGFVEDSLVINFFHKIK